MTVIEIIKKRYASKSFTGEVISSEQLKILKESIRLAPSSFNVQPWKVKIISDKELLKKLQGASYNQPQVGSASHLFVFCSVDSLADNSQRLLKKMEKSMPTEKYENYSGMIKQALNNMTPKSQKEMSVRELFMPAENLMLTATDLGLASCPMGGFVHAKYKEILEIPENLNPVVVIPVGFADDEGYPKFRFSDSEVFF